MKKIIIPTVVGAGVLLFLLNENKNSNTQTQKLIAPLKGHISSSFGNRIHPITGKNSFHNGVDVAVPTGTPIYSPADGTILGTYTNSTGGLQLLVSHKNGYITGYAHLSSVLRLKGISVKQGEKIALSGNSGNSTGPHLHFTLKKHDKTLLNPKFYINFA